MYAWLQATLKRKMANAFRARLRETCRRHEAEFARYRFAKTVEVDAAAIVDCRDRNQRIEAALDTLTGNQRLAVTLCFYGGWTLDEIAADFRISRPSAFRLIRRGLAALEKGGAVFRRRPALSGMPLRPRPRPAG